MGHAVYHRTASGEAQLEDVSSLEAAVELVERLRNEDGPTDVRLFKEIPVEVRTYYRVVVGDESEAPSGEQTTEETTEVVVPEASDELATSDDAPTEGSDDGIADDSGADDAEPAVAMDEAPAAESSRTPTEPPAGAMPLLSPPPPVTVHADDTDAEPAAATSGRPKLFNRG